MRKLNSGFLVVVCILSALTVAGCNGGTSSASANPPAVTIALSTPNGTTVVGQGESVTITATLSNDSSNRGVTWSMAGGGTLSNHTPASVMFTAPASVSSATSATITAASVAQPAVTQRITITINPPPPKLSIGTASLPAGTVGLPYAKTLPAYGGSLPYSWSISSGSPPGWVSLNTSTGVISGTPDAAGTASLTVQVTDSATPPASATQTLTLSVAQPDSVNNAALKGQYAFRLQGFDDATGNQFVMLGSFNADGNGHITSGIEDINGPAGYQSEVSFTGTYSVGADNRGIARFTDPSNTTFTIAVGKFSDSTVATQGSLIEFDDTDGMAGKRGSGSLFLQDPNTFSLARFNGPYAFLFAGQTQQTGTRLALAGAYTADGNGNVTNGQADTNTDGQMSAQTFTSTIATTANTAPFGRVIDTPAGLPFHFVHYIVGDERTLAMSTDPVSTSGLVAGEVLAQRSTPYSAASIKGTSVGYGVGKSTISMGAWTFDGLGTASYSQVWTDYDNFFLSLEPRMGSISYAATANGRVTTAGETLESGVPGAPIFYLVDANKGFLMSTDISASTGFFEPQTGGPFSNASLSGNYFFGTVTPAVANSGTVSGMGTSTGSVSLPSLTGTVDWSYPLHLLGTSQDFELDVAIGPDGFGAPPDPFFSTTSSPLYMISPGKFVVMEIDFPYPYPGPMITIFQR